MSYDTEAIRERVSIRELFERDGHQLKKTGGRWFALCPFHEERGASCHVNEQRGTFYCFGCQASGDIFAYWMQTRGVEFPAAGEALSQLAGTGKVEGDRYERPVRRVVEKVESEIPEPLSGRDLERWAEGVEYLLENAEERRKIAEWRSYSEETVLELARAGKIGMPLHYGDRRVAFPVEAVGKDGVPFLAGYHVRVPHREKPGEWLFMYTPSGIGGWPFVLGDPRSARALMIVEGQWDAIAFADGAGFGAHPKDVAIFGVRGASGWRKLLNWRWTGDLQIFAWSDNDEAGMKWWVPNDEGECFAVHLKLRSKALHAFTWQGVKDFNDAHRAAVVTPEWRAEWQRYLRELLRECWTSGTRRRRKRQPASLS